MSSSDRVDLWHGGAPGRRTGELLLSPSVTGLRRTSRDLSVSAGLGQIAYRVDLVYLTSDRDLTRVWAGQWTAGSGAAGYGWLYRAFVRGVSPGTQRRPAVVAWAVVLAKLGS